MNKGRVELHRGRNILCGIILGEEDIKPNQLWQASGGACVTVERVENGVVYYSWYEKGVKKGHCKDAFAFQCRYCKVVD